MEDSEFYDLSFDQKRRRQPLWDEDRPGSFDCSVEPGMEPKRDKAEEDRKERNLAKKKAAAVKEAALKEEIREKKRQQRLKEKKEKEPKDVSEAMIYEKYFTIDGDSGPKQPPKVESNLDLHIDKTSLEPSSNPSSLSNKQKPVLKAMYHPYTAPQIKTVMHAFMYGERILLRLKEAFKAGEIICPKDLQDRIIALFGCKVELAEGDAPIHLLAKPILKKILKGKLPRGVEEAKTSRISPPTGLTERAAELPQLSLSLSDAYEKMPREFRQIVPKTHYDLQALVMTFNQLERIQKLGGASSLDHVLAQVQDSPIPKLFPDLLKEQLQREQWWKQCPFCSCYLKNNSRALRDHNLKYHQMGAFRDPYKPRGHGTEKASATLDESSHNGRSKDGELAARNSRLQVRCPIGCGWAAPSTAYDFSELGQRKVAQGCLYDHLIVYHSQSQLQKWGYDRRYLKFLVGLISVEDLLEPGDMKDPFEVTNQILATGEYNPGSGFDEEEQEDEDVRVNQANFQENPFESDPEEGEHHDQGGQVFKRNQKRYQKKKRSSRRLPVQSHDPREKQLEEQFKKQTLRS